MTDAPHRVIDIVFNLYTPNEVAIRGRSVGGAFLSKVRVDDRLQRGLTVEDQLAILDQAGVDIALLPAIKAGDTRLRDSWAVPVTSLRPEDQRRKQRCVGLPLPLTELRIVDEEGKDVEPGQVGKLYSRSPFQFEGYHADPAATAEVKLDGFLTSGDLARRDEEGYVYIVGRASDVIITGGVNVYPREVEEYLTELPGVREAVVVGLPDPRWGEAVHAYLVAQPGTPPPSEEELKAHCRRGLAPAKIPRSFTFRETLPRTATGKVVRRGLTVAGEG